MSQNRLPERGFGYPQDGHSPATRQGGAIFTLADFAVATEVKEPGSLKAYDILVTDEGVEIIARFNGMVYRKNIQLTE
jgi:hypothetical protein